MTDLEQANAKLATMQAAWREYASTTNGTPADRMARSEFIGACEELFGYPPAGHELRWVPVGLETAPNPERHWYCPRCNEWVNADRVTGSGVHLGCGITLQYVPGRPTTAPTAPAPMTEAARRAEFILLCSRGSILHAVTAQDAADERFPGTVEAEP